MFLWYNHSRRREDTWEEAEEALRGSICRWTASWRRAPTASAIITATETLEHINDEFKHSTKRFTPAEILRQATANGAALLAMSGPKNPQPGKLGLIEEDAYADLLLVNGNPLEDISILTKPEENLALIVKDGKIYRNTLELPNFSSGTKTGFPDVTVNFRLYDYKGDKNECE